MPGTRDHIRTLLFGLRVSGMVMGRAACSARAGASLPSRIRCPMSSLRSRRPWRTVLTAGAVCLIALGCAGKESPGTSTFSGKVIYNNEPVTGGNMVLHPVNGGKPYTVALNHNGTFSVV